MISARSSADVPAAHLEPAPDAGASTTKPSAMVSRDGRVAARPVHGPPPNAEALADLEDTPHRLDIVAQSGAEAIRHAGGLICDRSLAGWTVTVTTVQPCTRQEQQALRILGCRHLLTTPLSARTTPHLRHQIVIAAALLTDQYVLNEHAYDAHGDRRADVLIFDDQFDFTNADHELSIAAHAFKEHALRELQMDNLPRSVEPFFRLDPTADSINPVLPLPRLRGVPVARCSPPPGGHPERRDDRQQPSKE